MMRFLSPVPLVLALGLFTGASEYEMVSDNEYFSGFGAKRHSEAKVATSVAGAEDDGAGVGPSQPIFTVAARRHTLDVPALPVVTAQSVRVVHTMAQSTMEDETEVGSVDEEDEDEEGSDAEETSSDSETQLLPTIAPSVLIGGKRKESE